jgi:adenine-specific DNA-methyltransferase
MNNFEKFEELLKSIFQFETADLDFGIYRVLNYKRKQIEKFVDEDLKNKVEYAFNKHKDERLRNIAKEFERIKEEVINTLGNDAITLTGDIKEEFKNIPLGIKFTQIKEKKEEAEKIDEIKDTVFNDLYKFFQRYYEEGDFVPQHRYSIKGHKYAIPYNGEEIKLYWANYDQYYIKTGLLFRDYTFKAEIYKIIFRTVSAKEELGSNKAIKQRFFILDDENPVEEKENQVIIRFQYKELSKEEKILKVYHQKFKEEKESQNEENGQKGNKIKQEKLNLIINEEILNNIKNNILKSLLEKEYKKDSKGDSISLLSYHLDRFTAKNTKDYFIHKNLKKFLSEQLEYFIKSEVLDIETIEKEKFLDKHITRAKVVREIGEAIIDFLSQIENFQKRLWEKKKFVIKTEYVITTDRIPEEFYDEIWENKEQKKEWKELGFEIPEKKEDLKNSKLPIDTKYFSSEFKEKLLEKLTEKTDLDDLLDGLLIKSENWQALNIILNKYKESIKTIYIDPPYNTGSDEFLYRDRYQHSSWLSMMENRLNLARELMNDDGVIFVSIDDREQENSKTLMKEIFGDDKFLAQIIRGIPDGTNLRTIGGVKNSTEYVISFLKEKEPLVNNLLFKDPVYREIVKDELSDFIETRLTKRGNSLSEILFPKGIGKLKEGLDLFLNEGNYINPSSREKILVKKGNLVIKDGILQEDIILEAPWSMPKVLKELFAGREVYDDSGQKYEYVFFKNNGIPYIVKSRGKTLIPSYLEVKNKTDELFVDIFGYEESPKGATVKPVELIYLLISFYADRNNIVVDFFAGSGTTAHAVMKLNKEDGGKRKFILVEMADYFDTIIIPRIKKIAYSFNWKDGKPQDKDGIGVFFKYQYLEQYEDSLDNIELEENKKAEELFKDEYLLKYFLDFETKDNPYLLNIEKLKSPFAYKLKVNLSEVGEPQEVVVDIPETFNYLLGIKLKRIKKRKNNGKDYLFILGEKEGQTYAIVWRELSGDVEEAKQDKDFIKKELKDWKPQIVYVNCPENTVLTSDFEPEFKKQKNRLSKKAVLKVEMRYIEPEFKKLMEPINYEN